MRKLAILSIIAVAAVASPSWGSAKKAGTSGAQFLKIGAGARPTALGDAFVGIADDVNSVYYNPGGLGLMKKAQFTAMHTQYIQGLNYDFGAFVQPLANSAIGISACSLKTDEMARRDADESLQGSFENQDTAYSFSYAHKLGDLIGLGATARWIRSQIDSSSAQTWAGDIGIIKRFEQPFSVGLAVRNFGSELKFQDEGDPLPLTIDAGAAMSLLHNRLTVGADARSLRDSGFKFGLGAEWRQVLRDKFRYAVRAGYNSAITDADGTGFAVGAGLGYKQFNFDFAWIPFGDLGNTFRYAVLFEF